jgi:hypothetical protein
MPRIGIVGGGVAGSQLGLFLPKHGIAATIYSEKTPAQQLAARISNVVVRNGPTRARERVLGVDHWDGTAPELVQFVVTVNGPRPLEFSGALTPPSHVVDGRGDSGRRRVRRRILPPCRAAHMRVRAAGERRVQRAAAATAAARREIPRRGGAAPGGCGLLHRRLQSPRSRVAGAVERGADRGGGEVAD